MVHAVWTKRSLLNLDELNLIWLAWDDKYNIWDIVFLYRNPQPLYVPVVLLNRTRLNPTSGSRRRSRRFATRIKHFQIHQTRSILLAHRLLHQARGNIHLRSRSFSLCRSETKRWWAKLFRALSFGRWDFQQTWKMEAEFIGCFTWFREKKRVYCRVRSSWTAFDRQVQFIRLI